MPVIVSQVNAGNDGDCVAATVVDNDGGAVWARPGYPLLTPFLSLEHTKTPLAGREMERRREKEEMEEERGVRVCRGGERGGGGVRGGKRQMTEQVASRQSSSRAQAHLRQTIKPDPAGSLLSTKSLLGFLKTKPGHFKANVKGRPRGPEQVQ